MIEFHINDTLLGNNVYQHDYYRPDITTPVQNDHHSDFHHQQQLTDYYDTSSRIILLNDTFAITTTIATLKAKVPVCDNSYDPYSDQSFFEFWICGVFLNIISVLGILGNILSMIILSRPQMRSSINYLLMGLAKCDIVLLITSILIFGLPTIYPYTGYLFYYYHFIYPNISPVVYTIAMSAQTASVYLTLTVTLERFVAVCHPLKARALCTYGRARIYFIVIVVFGLIYNVPRFWEVKLVRNEDKQLGMGMLICVFVSELRENKTYIKIYIQWLYLIFIYFIPFISLALLNTLIYKQVRKANRERQRLSRMEKREIGLATMLLCVVFVFFLCNILALVINILEASFGIINEYFVKISNLLVTINSSVNFIIYVIFGEKFKRIFLLLFCKHRIGRESPDGLMHDDSSYSNGDGTNRSSGRFQRTGTVRCNSSTTTINVTCNSANNSIKGSRIVRVRAPSPGPCVYYPGRDTSQRSVGHHNSHHHHSHHNGHSTINNNSNNTNSTNINGTNNNTINNNNNNSNEWSEREHLNGKGVATKTSEF